MVLIFISWIYIFFTIINLGFGFDKLLQLNHQNKVITPILGLFGVTIIASFWAVFGRINLEFHSILVLINVLLFFTFKKEIINFYLQSFQSIKNLNPYLKVYLVLISILILAQCATRPFIIDNETYYIQTIKWLNEYGFVKGLGNLHIFLGQTSGWHITQSVFNFSFLYNHFNDLSGFCLLLGNLFAISKLNDYFKNGIISNLIIGFIPVVNVLLFQFISAPSPDLPVYIFSFIAFYYFLNSFNSFNYQNFTILSILSLFVVFIKPTAIVLLILPLTLVLKDWKLVSKFWFPAFTIGLTIVGLLITKNIILTGHPFFPLNIFSSNQYTFAVPNELTNFYFNQKRMYRFMLTLKEFQELSLWDKFLKWISFRNISGIFNLLSLLFALVIPFVIKRFYNLKMYWILYVTFILQLLFLITTSPQFRFFIHFNLLFAFIILAQIINQKKHIYLVLSTSLIVVIFFLFVPINYRVLTQNKLILKNSNFSISQMVFPHNNSKMERTFLKIKEGNLIYHSPHPETFFWANGNGNLPCVNVKQIEYFKQYFNYIPQQNSQDIKDGFYSKKINPNE